MASCQECEAARAEFEDPRAPPLDTGNEVLCYQCFYTEVEQRIEELTDEISRLRDMQNASD